MMAMLATSITASQPFDTWPPAIEAGVLTIYQFYDLGDTIDLERAQACLTAPSTRRQSPMRVRQSASIQIAQPPLWVELGPIAAELGGVQFTGTLRATIYDLGVVALVFALPLPDATSWSTAADLFAAAQALPQPIQEHGLSAMAEVERLIYPAITHPARSPLVEDYSVMLVERLAAPCDIAKLAEHPLIQAALLGEQRLLSPHAAALVTSTSYYTDDLALLSWNGALLIEPDPLAAATTADLLEFANVELLLLRSYDADLEAELPRVYQRIASARRHPASPLVRRYARLLHEVQRLVLDVTEVTERIDNAFKVTDDVYWNRLYSAALNVLRVHTWHAGVEHRLTLLRETYGLLHHQAEQERAAILEWIIIGLILFEIIMALAGR